MGDVRVSRNTRTAPAPRRSSGDTAPAASASHFLRIPREPRALSRTWTRRFPPPGTVSQAANATPPRVNTRAPGSRSRAPGLHNPGSGSLSLGPYVRRQPQPGARASRPRQRQPGVPVFTSPRPSWYRSSAIDQDPRVLRGP